MPTPIPNPNKFTITSDSLNFQDSYNSNSGSGVDLHSPTSMEVSFRYVDFTPYVVTNSDYFIFCDVNTYGGNMDIDLATNASTFKHGKVIIVKSSLNSSNYDISFPSVTIDDNGSYTLAKDYLSIMLVYDKPNTKWWIAADK